MYGLCVSARKNREEVERREGREVSGGTHAMPLALRLGKQGAASEKED